jgi:hypothetical protein
MPISTSFSWRLVKGQVMLATCFTLVSYLACFSTLKMEATCSSEASVVIQRTTRCYIPEDRALHNYLCERLKSYKFVSSLLCNGFLTESKCYHRRYIIRALFVLKDWKAVFFFSFLGWSETESTFYCGHYWPIVSAADDRWWWLWSNWWNEAWQGKPKYSEKTCPSATLSITNPTWPDLGSKPATNSLSYGTAPGR